MRTERLCYLQDTEEKWTIRATVINRRKHQGVESSSYMLKKSETGHMTWGNEHAIRIFGGDTLDTGAEKLVGSREDTSKSGDKSAMNISTPSRPHIIPSLCKNNNSIHDYRLSSTGRAVTEHEAQEREKGQELTAQSTPGVNSKKSLRFSKVCEVITFAGKEG